MPIEPPYPSSRGQAPTGPADAGPDGGGPSSMLSDVASVSRYVLAISYPVLALSTGARALYRLFLKDGIDLQVAAGLSLLAACLYLGATVGFAVRQRWAWYVSFGLLSVETALTLIVGAISLLEPEIVGRTVWRAFGADYGWFPLFQPLLGLIWLAWPPTIRAYGVTADWLPDAWYRGEPS